MGLAITDCPAETIEAFARCSASASGHFPAGLRFLTLAQRRRQHARGKLHSGGHRRLAARRGGAFFNNRAIYHWDKTMIEGTTGTIRRSACSISAGSAPF